MWQLIVVLGTVAVLLRSSVTAVTSLKQIDEKLDEFLSSTDNVKVVYFLRGT